MRLVKGNYQRRVQKIDKEYVVQQSASRIGLPSHNRVKV